MTGSAVIRAENYLFFMLLQIISCSTLQSTKGVGPNVYHTVTECREAAFFFFRRQHVMGFIHTRDHQAYRRRQTYRDIEHTRDFSPARNIEHTRGIVHTRDIKHAMDTKHTGSIKITSAIMLLGTPVCLKTVMFSTTETTDLQFRG